MTIFEEAKELLVSKGLQEILEKYGSIAPTGSYSLNLMTWRDLDLYLISEDITQNEFFQLGAEINDLLNPVKMNFRNEFISKTEGLPEGLYWGIYLGNERDDAWKIDLWCVSRKEAMKGLQYCKDIESKLNKSNRKVIHELKDKCWRNENYRKKFYSTDIYSAVLDHGISSFEEFKIYINIKYGSNLIG